MNILYLGKYNQRFKSVENLLNPRNDKNVIELCFGDTMIAKWCKLNDIKWAGFDINEEFIKNARLEGYNAHYKDILKLENLPKSDAVIIMGSLYQFNEILDDLINCVMSSTSKFIISEPISNLATKGNLIGYLAKRSTKVGNGNEMFRYNYDNLHSALRNVCDGRFAVSEIKRTQKDLILVIRKI